MTGALGTQYTQAYNTALAQNQNLYNQILGGYQQRMADQTTAQQAIQGGYSGLYNSVLDQMKGQGQSQMQTINDNFAAATGRVTQDAINRGLGNSTILTSAARGLEYDRAKAGNDLAERLGRMNSDYMSRIGLSSLDYQNAANQQNTNLDLNKLNWLNTIQARYPDANMYARLAEMQGAAEQAQAARDDMRGGYAGNPPPSGTLSGTYGSPPRGADNIPGVTAPAYGYGMGSGVGLGATAGYSPPPMTRESLGLPTDYRDYSPGSYGDMWTDTPSFWQQGYNYLTSQADLGGGGYDWGGGGEF